MRSYGWPALIAALPLIYLFIRLRGLPSRRSVALGIAYPLVILISFWLTILARYRSGTEGAMDVVYSFVFFWYNIVWAIFILAFVPTMACLLVVSIFAYGRLPKRGVMPIVGWMLVLLVGAAVAAAGRMTGATPDANVPEYRPDVVDNAIAPLNECIWRAAGFSGERGFPDSLGAIRYVEWRTYPGLANKYPNKCIANLESLPTQPFSVEYEAIDRDAKGRARGFKLRLVEKTRSGGRPRITWYDEANLRRDGILTAKGTVDSVRVSGSSALNNVLIAQHLVDDFARTHAGSYPTRIVPEWKYPNTPPPNDVLTMTDVGECSGFTDANASCIERWDRQIIYTPINRGGVVHAYTLAMQPLTYYDNQQQRPIPSRTHFRDTDGVLHSFGGWRPANASDPPPDSVELRMATEGLRNFLQQMR